MGIGTGKNGVFQPESRGNFPVVPEKTAKKTGIFGHFRLESSGFVRIRFFPVQPWIFRWFRLRNSGFVPVQPDNMPAFTLFFSGSLGPIEPENRVYIAVEKIILFSDNFFDKIATFSICMHFSVKLTF